MQFKHVIRRITFLHTHVNDQMVRPQHDLSHPARMKKQIDASSHYNSLPPFFSISLLYAGHRTTDKTSFIIRASTSTSRHSPRREGVSTNRSFRTKSVVCEYLRLSALRWRWLCAIQRGDKIYHNGKLYSRITCVRVW